MPHPTPKIKRKKWWREEYRRGEGRRGGGGGGRNVGRRREEKGIEQKRKEEKGRVGSIFIQNNSLFSLHWKWQSAISFLYFRWLFAPPLLLESHFFRMPPYLSNSTSPSHHTRKTPRVSKFSAIIEENRIEFHFNLWNNCYNFFQLAKCHAHFCILSHNSLRLETSCVRVKSLMNVSMILSFRAKTGFNWSSKRHCKKLTRTFWESSGFWSKERIR